MELPKSIYCDNGQCQRQVVFKDVLESGEYNINDIKIAMMLACLRIRYKNPKLPCTLGYTAEQWADFFILRIKQRFSSQTD